MTLPNGPSSCASLARAAALGALLGASGCAAERVVAPEVTVPRAAAIERRADAGPVEIAFASEGEAHWSLRHWPSLAVECDLPCTRTLDPSARLVLYRDADDAREAGAIRMPTVVAGEGARLDATALPARGSPGVSEALATAAVIPVLIGTAGLLSLVAGPPRGATDERANATETTSAAMLAGGYGTALVLGAIALGYEAYYRPADTVAVRSTKLARRAPREVVYVGPTGVLGRF
jgi:hypothetical protein